MTLRTLGRTLEVAAGGDPHARRHRASASIASTTSAAAARASCRRSIGVVPAWLAAPHELDVDGLAAGDAGDHAELLAGRVEHRPLLDVQLDEGSDRVAVPAGRRSSGAGVAAGVGRRSRDGRRRRRRAAASSSSPTSPTSARLPTMPSVPRAPSSLANATTTRPWSSGCRRRAARRRPRRAATTP